ncbi:MAG: integrase arm-type DNA-binding domain-containing protein [Pseudobdellovibrionaceae bacterium]|jgi:integrase|nr:integrase arm-type DNA-binding domain-containing protein [Pseudobdellovibrionaceae bacterium]
MPLTAKACQAAQPKEKPYKIADGGGMYLEVMPNGSKYWRLKYRWLGKEKRLAFGVFPEVTLAEAREKREEARKLIGKGLDPSENKKQEKRQAVINANNTFQSVAMEWMEIQKERWTKGYAQKTLRRLEMHIFPCIGNRPISQISPPELLECLRKIEKRGTLEMASRGRELSGQIFRYGIQTGRCERDAAADLRGALKTKKAEHFRTIDEKQIPELLHALSLNNARIFERTRRAVWFSLLTFGRPGEIRQACWSQIDFDDAIWYVHSGLMKMRRDHVVPLSKQALAVLQEQKEETGHIKTDYVFPSQVNPRKCMSDGTVNRAIERLGFGESMVAHGVRALARTTIRERLGFDSEIIEKQLSHKTKNPLGEAYDRTQFLSQRKKMMQEWADYLDSVASEGKIIHGNFGKVS